jgi:MoxR-like ATPase
MPQVRWAQHDLGEQPRERARFDRDRPALAVERGARDPAAAAVQVEDDVTRRGRGIDPGSEDRRRWWWRQAFEGGQRDTALRVPKKRPTRHRRALCQRPGPTTPFPAAVEPRPGAAGTIGRGRPIGTADEVQPMADPGQTTGLQSLDRTGAPSRRPDGRHLWASVREAVGEAVVGAESALRLVLVALLADGHALVEDVPGVGKTLLARAVARALGLDTARLQGTPDLLPIDVTGSSILEDGRLRFVAGPVFTNILLVDEINRATPRTQSALLEAMQERQVSIEGATRPLPQPFLVLATQNPIEYEGTFALPEAQLDRFLVRVRIGYPNEADERRIARRYLTEAEPLELVQPVLDAQRVLDLRDVVRQLLVSGEIEAYIVAISQATRDHPDLQLGASPRASVALFRASQAWAFLDGRAFVLPDDVKAVAPSVLGHRLVVDLDRGLRGASADQVLEAILASVPVPPVSAAASRE